MISSPIDHSGSVIPSVAYIASSYRPDGN